LIDKVVGSVFGESKNELYKNYPKLADVTIPKMAIITPRGDEVIFRKKFDETLTILKDHMQNKEEEATQDIS
jgi:hypothetical protein